MDAKPLRIKNPWWQKSQQQVLLPCQSGVVVDTHHGKRVLARCEKWTCQYCGPLKKKALTAEIGAVRENHDGLCVMSVLTFYHQDGTIINPRSGKRIAEASAKVYVRRWYALAKRILGTSARVTVPEFGKTGKNLHFNVIWFGVKRTYWDCGGRTQFGKVDARLWCGRCPGCQLRNLWTAVSGAVRSTHEVTRGNAAAYVAKYLMKELHETRKGWKRFSWSRSAKRPPAVMPVYRYICQRLREGGMWFWGRRNSKADVEGRDYLCDSRVWWNDRPKYQVTDATGIPDGIVCKRDLCTNKHGGACDSVPYFSRSRIKAWGGVEATWRYVSKVWGEETSLMVESKIKSVMTRAIPRLEYMHDAYAGHF